MLQVDDLSRRDKNKDHRRFVGKRGPSGATAWIGWQQAPSVLLPFRKMQAGCPFGRKTKSLQRRNKLHMNGISICRLRNYLAELLKAIKFGILNSKFHQT